MKIPYSIGFKYYKNNSTFTQIIDLFTKPIPRSFMLGSGFSEKFNLLLKSERWKQNEFNEFQLKKMRSLLNHAYYNVPYYHSIFKNINFHPLDFNTLSDLKKLPLLDRDKVRSNFNNIISIDKTKYKPDLTFTAGSTGAPLEFYLDQNTREIAYAVEWRQIFWGGVNNLNVKVAAFRGDLVFNNDKNTIYKNFNLYKQLSFNSYNINNSTIKKIVEKLNQFKPIVIKAYPHSIFLVSKLIEENDLKLTYYPKVILTSSEQLLSTMRDKIEEIFNSKILDLYGQSEYIISFSQCEKGSYHNNREMGILDFIEDEWGYERIVGTSIWNYSFPFINYLIGDIIDYKNNLTCDCGRTLPVINNIEGRINDVLISTNGSTIGGAAFDRFWKYRVSHNLKIQPKYIHFIQKSIDSMIIEIFMDSKIFTNHDLKIINENLKSLLNNNLNIEFKYLDSSPNIKKWKIVESRVTNNK